MCPICKRRDIIWWGDSPCPRCQEDYTRLKKAGKIPEGGGFDLWAKAREKGVEALAEGKTMEEAKVIAQNELAKLAAKRLEDAARSAAYNRSATPDPRIAQLFE